MKNKKQNSVKKEIENFEENEQEYETQCWLSVSKVLE